MISHFYSLGYDLGSSFIHPRADEGFWDALRIVKNEKMVEFKKNSILKNSILIANGILMSASNRSEFKFDNFLNYYCSSIFDYLIEDKEFPDLKGIEKTFYANMIVEVGKN